MAFFRQRPPFSSPLSGLIRFPLFAEASSITGLSTRARGRVIENPPSGRLWITLAAHCMRSKKEAAMVRHRRVVPGNLQVPRLGEHGPLSTGYRDTTPSEITRWGPATEHGFHPPSLIERRKASPAIAALPWPSRFHGEHRACAPIPLSARCGERYGRYDRRWRRRWSGPR